MYKYVGLTTNNLWPVSLRFVHCVSVVPVAMYCRIEWCVSQPQSALAFRLAPTTHAKDWNFHVSQWWQWIQSSLLSQDYYHTW